MPIMEISIVPIGTKTTSISKYVAASEEVLRNEKSAKGQITAMGTIVESHSTKELFAIALKMHKRAFASGAKRVLTNIVIDERRDKKASIESKVESVRRKLKI